MARRKLEHKLIDKDNIIEPLKLIKESDTDYITPTGRVYKDYGNNKMFPKKTFINKHNGYIYCGITTPVGNKQRRVHRLVAEAFLPNPNNYTVVGHKDNNKSNPCVDNLYWTTIQENTQKAFDDGLAYNARGWEDSQSIPICIWDINGVFVEACGSVTETCLKYGVTKSGILHQCRHKPKKIRKKYYFRFYEEYKDFVL